MRNNIVPGTDESFRNYFYPKGYGNGETFYSTDAEKMATHFDLGRMTFTTLRRYYAEVETLCRTGKGIDRQDDSAREIVLMRLNLLLAKANFDKGRPGMKIPEEFLPFLRLGISFTKGHREIETFKRHFEAVVAYAKTIFKK